MLCTIIYLLLLDFVTASTGDQSIVVSRFVYMNTDIAIHIGNIGRFKQLLVICSLKTIKKTITFFKCIMYDHVLNSLKSKNTIRFNFLDRKFSLNLFQNSNLQFCLPLMSKYIVPSLGVIIFNIQFYSMS